MCVLSTEVTSCPRTSVSTATEAPVVLKLLLLSEPIIAQHSLIDLLLVLTECQQQQPILWCEWWRLAGLTVWIINGDVNVCLVSSMMQFSYRNTDDIKHQERNESWIFSLRFYQQWNIFINKNVNKSKMHFGCFILCKFRKHQIYSWLLQMNTETNLLNVFMLQKQNIWSIKY